MIHPIDQLKIIQPAKKDDSAAQLISMTVLFAGLYLLLRKPEQAVGESVLEGNPRAPIARKLISDEDKQAVKELYEDGYTIEDIAEVLGVSGNVINSVLRETQAEIRPSNKPRVIPSDKVDEVVELYLQGLDLYEVAEKFGVSRNAVQRRLLEQNIQIRSQERFDVDDEEIKALYAEGLSIRQIAVKLNMSDTAVGSRLRRMGTVIRSPPKLSDEEIVKLYLQGLTLQQIADKFNVSSGAILSRLEKMGVARRTQSENERLGLGRKKQHLSNEEIKKLYLEGLTLKQIAEKFDVNISTIVDRLTKMGVERRAYTQRKSKAGNPYTVTKRMELNAKDSYALGKIKIDPDDFLRLTTDDPQFVYDDNKERNLTYQDYENFGLREETIIHPFLRIDVSTGVVTGHEGRHRAAAAKEAGENFYVHIYPDYDSKTGKLKKAVLEGFGEQFIPDILIGQFNPEVEVKLDKNLLGSNLFPTYRKKLDLDVIRKMYVEDKRTINQIAARFRVSPTVIKSRLYDLRIPIDSNRRVYQSPKRRQKNPKQFLQF